MPVIGFPDRSTEFTDMVTCVNAFTETIFVEGIIKIERIAKAINKRQSFFFDIIPYCMFSANPYPSILTLFYKKNLDYFLQLFSLFQFHYLKFQVLNDSRISSSIERI